MSIARIRALIAGPLTAWRLYLANERAKRLLREVQGIPITSRGRGGRFVSGVEMRKQKINERLRKEVAK